MALPMSRYVISPIVGGRIRYCANPSEPTNKPEVRHDVSQQLKLAIREAMDKEHDTVEDMIASLDLRTLGVMKRGRRTTVFGLEVRPV